MLKKQVKYLFLLIGILSIGYNTTFIPVVDSSSHSHAVLENATTKNLNTDVLDNTLKVRTSLPIIDNNKHKIHATDNEGEEDELISFKKEVQLSTFFNILCYTQASNYFSNYIKNRFLFFKRFKGFYSYKKHIIFQVFRI